MALTPTRRRGGHLLGCVAAPLIILLQPALTFGQQPPIVPRLPPPSELKGHITVSLACAGGPAAVRVTVANDEVENTRVLLGEAAGISRVTHRPRSCSGISRASSSPGQAAAALLGAAAQSFRGL